ncbi:hypothetical protein PX699_13375 [Sphingobium sp. H39-3-25]|uniref:hypothetical protein n=1 Tax=Sphingobium arseniciresistens TaxID=3030834 RepID=UPI0023BA26CC|nr:hypothetical protein [Sphingobium arseniciresistens]
MPRFDLAAIASRQRNIRRRAIVIRDIAPPATMATNLFHRVYLPIITAWERAAPAIIAEYERTLSSMVTDAPADVQAAIDGPADAISRLLLLLTPEIRDWVLSVSSYIDRSWSGAILSAAGVDISILIGPEDARQTVDAYLEWNTSLIRDVSAQARQRISNFVFTGLNQRKPAREVAKDIREAVSMGRDRSIRIASHQLSSLSSELARERRRQAGLDVFAWHHSQKRYPRQEHVKRNGVLYTENADLVGKKLDGRVVKLAPPADDRAGVRPACGCRERGILVFGWDDD